MTVFIGNITTVASPEANQKKAAYFLLAVSLAATRVKPSIFRITRRSQSNRIDDRTSRTKSNAIE